MHLFHAVLDQILLCLAFVSVAVENSQAPISEETLTTFLSAWEAQTLTPFMKSQPVPEPVKGQHVRVLVGSNFEVRGLSNQTGFVLSQ